MEGPTNVPVDDSSVSEEVLPSFIQAVLAEVRQLRTFVDATWVSFALLSKFELLQSVLKKAGLDLSSAALQFDAEITSRFADAQRYAATQVTGQLPYVYELGTVRLATVLETFVSDLVSTRSSNEGPHGTTRQSRS